MPAYDWECELCGKQQEQFFTIKDCPRTVPCSCGHSARKIITIRRHGVQVDEPSWLTDGSTAMALCRPGDKPILNRTDLKRHLRAHPEIVPLG